MRSLYLRHDNTGRANPGVAPWHGACGAEGACKQVTAVSNGLVGAAAAAPARTGTDRGNAALAPTQSAPTSYWEVSGDLHDAEKLAG